MAFLSLCWALSWWYPHGFCFPWSCGWTINFQGALMVLLLFLLLQVILIFIPQGFREGFNAEVSLQKAMEVLLHLKRPVPEWDRETSWAFLSFDAQA